MKTLEQLYIDKALECKAKSDDFGYHYYMQRAFEVACMEEL